MYNIICQCVYDILYGFSKKPHAKYLVAWRSLFHAAENNHIAYTSQSLEQFSAFFKKSGVRVVVKFAYTK